MTLFKPNRGPAGSAERGGAIIEFALSFGILFSVLTGVFQFGYAFYQYNHLVSVVRAGARFASLRTYDSSTATPSAEFSTAVRNMVVYGDPAGGSLRLVRGLTPEKVTVTMAMDSNLPYQVTVSITNFQIDAVVASMTLNGKPKATFPYVGRYAP